MSNEEETLVKIDRSTLVPIGVVVVLLVGIFGIFGYLDSRFTAQQTSMDVRFTTIDKALEKQDRRLEKLEEKGDKAWTSIQQELWVSEFRRLNPKVKVPHMCGE